MFNQNAVLTSTDKMETIVHKAAEEKNADMKRLYEDLKELVTTLSLRFLLIFNIRLSRIEPNISCLTSAADD